MTLHAPQLILLTILVLGMGVNIARIGQQKRGSYDWADVLIGPAIMMGLLYWGGFFG